jgi:pSer/pThr/pTyr-binding forkhead associated (FHA) protein
MPFMIAKLTITAGAESNEVIFRQFPITIGRAANAGCRICDPWISRSHCEIYEVDGTLAVRDHGSKYGTWVNGHRITDATLKPGDKLTVGLSTLVPSWESATAVAS